MNFTDFAEIELKGLEKEARAVNQQLAAVRIEEKLENNQTVGEHDRNERGQKGTDGEIL